jgi:uncharacterized membrane protein YphA (DoxX/SURF4 family)
MAASHRLPRVAILLAALAPLPEARAHVDYVGPGGGAGDPGTVLARVLADPGALALLGAGAVAALAAAGAALWIRRWSPDVVALLEALDEYEAYVPWILRLSVGLPLVGAGFAGYLYTPAIPADLRLPQVIVGFLLLLGLATRAAAAAGLAGYLATLAAYGDPALLAFEYVGGLLAVVLVGPGRPSADHMLATVATRPSTLLHRWDPVHPLAAWWSDRMGHLTRWAPAAVRVPLGLGFLYLGVTQKLLDPGPALALVDGLGLPTAGPLTPALWVAGAGLVEAAVGLLLLVGGLTRLASALAFLVLTTTLLALPNDPVLAHVTLFGLSSVVFTWGAGPISLDGRRAPAG